MNNKTNKTIKEIYEKNKLSISYNEFISLIKQLQDSCENIDFDDMKNTKEIFDQNKLNSSFISQEINENSTLYLDTTDEQTHESLCELSSIESSNSNSGSNTLSFENDKIKIINYMDINEDNVSKILLDKSSNTSNSNDLSETLSYPSEFTSEKKSLKNDTLISYSSFPQSEIIKSMDFDKYKNLNDDENLNNLNNNYLELENKISNFDANNPIKYSKSSKTISSENSKNTKNNDNNTELGGKKINIKVNPKIEYLLDIDLNNNISITIG